MPEAVSCFASLPILRAQILDVHLLSSIIYTLERASLSIGKGKGYDSIRKGQIGKEEH